MKLQVERGGERSAGLKEKMGYLWANNKSGTDKNERRRMLKMMREGIVSDLKNPSNEDVFAYIEERVLKGKECQNLTYVQCEVLIRYLFHSLRSDLSILQPLAEDNTVSEIMVNGKDAVFVEQNGKLCETDIAFDDVEDLEEVIRRLAAKVHREINELHPVVDARMKDGSRVNAVFKNIALGGPVLTIRKFPEKALTMSDLIQFGTLTEECAESLKKLVQSGYNCFISGGTSSGKTTFLNVLSEYIPSEERVIVIEDSAELQIQNVKNLVRLECRNANAEGKGRVDMRDLIRTSLRMRPNRIIVGEVRGAEVMEMLQAMNTGHPGSLSTGHGNSVLGMFRRLETMFLQAADYPMEAVRAQILEGIDIFIHLERDSDGKRRVREVVELTGLDEQGKPELNTLFSFSKERGLVKMAKEPVHAEKLLWKGMTL